MPEFMEDGIQPGALAKNPVYRISNFIGLILLFLAVTRPLACRADDPPHLGLLFDKFELTLEPGNRTEAAGPLYYNEQTETRRTWALPPLISYTQEPNVELEEIDSLYPIFSYDRYGGQFRWQLLQLLSYAGGESQTETNRNRFTIFPIFFQQRSSDPSQNYLAVGPFYGHLQNRLFRDEITYIMFPFYGQSRKKDVITDNYLYPFFHLRQGVGLTGWQFWPLLGHEHKDVSSKTNMFNELGTVPGHDSVFAFWPIYFNDKMSLGTENPAHQLGVLPFYRQERSPERDSTSVLWPLFTHIDDRGQKYREWDLPWPLVEFARGEGKTTSRVMPFYGHSHNAELATDTYLWPLYKAVHINASTLQRERQRILYFLYNDIQEMNKDTGATARRIELLPFFSYRRDFKGNTRMQVLTVLEPFTMGSHKIERDYSQLWALWRSEHNPKTGAASQSLLWNLYRRDTTPARKQVSVFFGLFQAHSGDEGRQVRLFHIPLAKTAAAPSGTIPADDPRFSPLKR
jgi:hypothetical protein